MSKMSRSQVGEVCKHPEKTISGSKLFVLVGSIGIALSGCSTKSNISPEKAEVQVMAEREYTLQQLQDEYVHILKNKHKAKPISENRQAFLNSCSKDLKEIESYKKELKKKADKFNSGDSSRSGKRHASSRWGKNRLDSVYKSTGGTVYVDKNGNTLVPKGKPCPSGDVKVKKIEVDDNFLEVPSDKDKKTIQKFY